MRDDAKIKEAIETLRAIIDEKMSGSARVRRSLENLLADNPEVDPPWTFRFGNLEIVEAIRRFLQTEKPAGATQEEIETALRGGGRAYNDSDFKKHLGTSITTSVTSGVLIRDKDLIKIGKKPPSTRSR